MAENEVLDFGHRDRWKRSRLLLRDPASSMFEFVSTAADECREAVRRLPAALRKGPPLLMLLRAMQGSITGLQEVVAAFTEKRLANLVIAAAKCDSSGRPEGIAHSAARNMVETLIDQIAARAKKEQRFCSEQDQAALRAALTNEFAPFIAPLSETIESSMRGTPVRRIKALSAPNARMRPKDVAIMSLVAPSRPEQPHAP